MEITTTTIIILLIITKKTIMIIPIDVASVNILTNVKTIMTIDAINTTGKITAIKKKKEKSIAVTTQYFGLLDVVDSL